LRDVLARSAASGPPWSRAATHRHRHRGCGSPASSRAQPRTHPPGHQAARTGGTRCFYQRRAGARNPSPLGDPVVADPLRFRGPEPDRGNERAAARLRTRPPTRKAPDPTNARSHQRRDPPDAGQSTPPGPRPGNALQPAGHQVALRSSATLPETKAHSVVGSLTPEEVDSPGGRAGGSPHGRIDQVSQATDSATAPTSI
jgi:hypothetical protein